MQDFGVDLNTLEVQAPVDIPDVVSGRILNLDADVSAYHCAYMDISLEACINNLKVHIETQRLMAAATHINLHLTMGTKGGRSERAEIKEYQENRKERDPLHQARVRSLRMFMETYSTDVCTPVVNKHQEADDSLAQYQYADFENSIIMTIDKDLDMIPGKHIHPETYDEWYLDPNGDTYGSIWIKEMASGKKVKGQGTAFFWAQMLMGDSADNIPGLPRVGARILNKYKPTAAMLKDPTSKAALRAMEKRKDGLCGAVTAYDILKGAKSDLEAYKIVRDCYKSHYGNSTMITTWQDERVTRTVDELIDEQAFLLWMRRIDDPDDWSYFRNTLIGDKK